MKTPCIVTRGAPTLVRYMRKRSMTSAAEIEDLNKGVDDL
jgi:hypothetical protein